MSESINYTRFVNSFIMKPHCTRLEKIVRSFVGRLAAEGHTNANVAIALITYDMEKNEECTSIGILFDIRSLYTMVMDPRIDPSIQSMYDNYGVDIDSDHRFFIKYGHNVITNIMMKDLHDPSAQFYLTATLTDGSSRRCNVDVEIENPSVIYACPVYSVNGSGRRARIMSVVTKLFDCCCTSNNAYAKLFLCKVGREAKGNAIFNTNGQKHTSREVIDDAITDYHCQLIEMMNECPIVMDHTACHFIVDYTVMLVTHRSGPRAESELTNGSTPEREQSTGNARVHYKNKTRSRQPRTSRHASKQSAIHKERRNHTASVALRADARSILSNSSSSTIVDFANCDGDMATVNTCDPNEEESLELRVIQMLRDQVRAYSNALEAAGTIMCAIQIPETLMYIKTALESERERGAHIGQSIHSLLGEPDNVVAMAPETPSAPYDGFIDSIEHASNVPDEIDSLSIHSDHSEMEPSSFNSFDGPEYLV